MTATDDRPTGAMIIGGEPVHGTGAELRGYDPAAARELEPGFPQGDASHVERAAALAEEAFDAYRHTTSAERAAFLERIADRLTEAGPAIVARAMAETGLPRPRLEGELGRTTGQLRLFAGTLRQGGWHGVRVDPAQPGRTPLPRADIRQRRVPLGPVAVFAASNFPLAFSVAGGDTASALAAGCPVIVKGHGAHPGTAELTGRAVAAAVRDSGLPPGVFSLLFGPGSRLGTALVTDPRVRAVGFTGSRQGGTALVAAAAARPTPIPVYAEMSAVNPVFLLPSALAARAEELGAGFVGSLTLGAGQFCTNPGLVLAVAGPDLNRFTAAAAAALRESAAQTMLTPAIARAHREGTAGLGSDSGIEEVARGLEAAGDHQGRAALFRTDAATFRASATAGEEVFGATSLVVACRDTEELLAVAAGLEGQLTATVHADTEDHPTGAALLRSLELRVGRVLFNGWPTGVEVGHAMVHGGPHPATSDGRTTSVGSLAVDRFLRPVAYQDVPAALLPPVLADGNPEGVPRLVDGVPAAD